MILTDPTNADLCLVYADWLEERGEPGNELKAEYLRLGLTLESMPVSEPSRRQFDERRAVLRDLMTDSWWRMFNRAEIVNCDHLVFDFQFKCLKTMGLARDDGARSRSTLFGMSGKSLLLPFESRSKNAIEEQQLCGPRFPTLPAATRPEIGSLPKGAHHAGTALLVTWIRACREWRRNDFLSAIDYAA
jgi:uncharacterized protein (TIGR02996 family)